MPKTSVISWPPSRQSRPWLAMMTAKAIRPAKMVKKCKAVRRLFLDQGPQHLVVCLPRAQDRDLVDLAHLVEPHHAAHSCCHQLGVGILQAQRFRREQDDAPTAVFLHPLDGDARAVL